MSTSADASKASIAEELSPVQVIFTLPSSFHLPGTTAPWQPVEIPFGDSQTFIITSTEFDFMAEPTFQLLGLNQSFVGDLIPNVVLDGVEVSAVGFQADQVTFTVTNNLVLTPVETPPTNGKVQFQVTGMGNDEVVDPQIPLEGGG